MLTTGFRPNNEVDVEEVKKAKLSLLCNLKNGHNMRAMVMQDE